MCNRFSAIYDSWSREKQNVIYFALAGVYRCPYCRANHKLDYKEATPDVI